MWLIINKMIKLFLGYLKLKNRKLMVKMENLSQKSLGLILTIFGLAIFIALMGDLLFRLVGGFMALAMINYGLQMQGLPPFYFYLINLFNFRR